jgi:hypothetical protein
MTELIARAFRRCILSLLAVVFFSVPVQSRAGVAISITIAPPALPVYTQPPCPMDGYLWIPGYWAWGPAGYYWVPGTWVLAPRPGLLWTPGYWAFAGGIYLWHPGYWGPHIGFYGGVNYGFGYFGTGFYGGYWSGGHFLYNTAVMHVNVTNIHYVYNKTVVRNVYVNNTRVSFNGPGGIRAVPSPAERVAMREQHFQPTGVQLAHERAASVNRAQLASVNHGRPAMFAMARPMNASHPNVNHPGPPPGNPGARPQPHEQPANNHPQQQQHRPPHPEHSRQNEEHESPR